MSDSENPPAAPAVDDSKTRILRVGFLGASGIAHKVWPAIEAASSVQVTCVAARDPTRAAAFIAECAESMKLPEDRLPIAATYEQLVTSDEVDVVYISIPVTLREQWIHRCAENGKHVVCEKPLADAEALRGWIEALSAKQLLFMDGTMCSHGPYLAALVKALPRIGSVRRITSCYSFGASESFLAGDIRCDPAMEPMGCLGDVGWYCVRGFLHVMNFAMPVAVTGRVIERNAKGAIIAFTGDLTFRDPADEDGIVTAQFHCSFLYSSENMLVISGSEAVLTAPDVFIPVTDKPSAFTIARATMGGEDCELRVTRAVETVTTAETGHVQETEMWRDVRDCLRRDADTGRLVVDPAEAKKWGQRAWITQCILDKLMESAGAQAPPTQ